MKRHLPFVFAAGLAAATLVVAQEPVHPTSPTGKTTTSDKGSRETVEQTKTTTDAGTTETTTDRLFGKVESYEPGKSIKVTTPGKLESSRTVDLQGKNLTAHVTSSIKNGSWVTIIEKTDNNGHKTVTVTPAKSAARSQ